MRPCDTNVKGSRWDSNWLEAVMGNRENLNTASPPYSTWGRKRSNFHSRSRFLEMRGVRPNSGQYGRENIL